MLLFVLFIIALFLLYTVIPFVLSRWMGIGVFQKSQYDQRLAFTFDDGPDPLYTVQLLDVLNQYSVKASFFVVGERAERFPEIIERMHMEGHLIGIHNYTHRSNWLMSPWKVKEGVEKTAQIIEQITGHRPVYYRPPWGMLNLFDYWIHPHYQIILWSVIVGDWRSKGGAARILQSLQQSLHPGAVILLHDCGATWGADEDAPKYTIAALRQLLSELAVQNKGTATVNEMLQKKKGLHP